MDPFSGKKALRDHVVSLTKELIRFPSHVQEPLKIFELIEFIKSYFEKEKVNLKTFTFGGLPSLVITFEETKHPNIMLSGHIDVVPSSTNYTAEEKEGWLWGSGSMDMKGGVACMMAVMKYFARQENPPSLGLMITSDEEIGSENGTKKLLEEEQFRANFAIVNEGRDKYDIVLREKGLLIIKFEKNGVFAHSAYPWKVPNAMEDLMEALLKLKKIFPKPSDKWVPTASITVFSGGKEKNTIPGYAAGYMNIRLTGGKNWSRDVVLEKIKQRLPKDVTMPEMIYGSVFFEDAKNPHVKLLKAVAQKVTGKKMQFGENHGGSDARIFQENHIPTAILGPVGKDHHTPNECVDIESLVTHFDVLKTFIEKEKEHSLKPVEKLQTQ